MSTLWVTSLLCLQFWAIVQGNIYDSGEFVFQNVLRWNYTYMNPTCTGPAGSQNPCQDVRICTFAAASLAMGGWPTLCGWVADGVPKVCCGPPLVLGPSLMKKIEEEKTRKRECGTLRHSLDLSETEKKFFEVFESLPNVDISEPEKFDPPLDLDELLVYPVTYPRAPFIESRQGDFQWMVSIRINGSHLCGGSLIDRKHILTSAHCSLGSEDQYAVHVGNLYVDDGYVFHVSKITIHPEYQLGNSKNLAILTLKEEIISTFVPHICLDGKDSDAANLQRQNTTMLRWGKQTILNGTGSQILRVIDGLTIVPMEECQRSYADKVKPDELEDFICTTTNQSNNKSCEEDYGGPLMYDDASSRWIMIGVDTFGSMCEERKHLRLYTKLLSYLNWISEVTNE